MVRNSRILFSIKLRNAEIDRAWTVPTARFTKGYAKNVFGSDYDSALAANNFDISDVVDSLGKAVDLPHIRFIKVKTGVFQQAVWLNAISTDLMGAKDLKK